MLEGKGTRSSRHTCLLALASWSLFACSLTDDLDELSAGISAEAGGAAGSSASGGTGAGTENGGGNAGGVSEGNGGSSAGTSSGDGGTESGGAGSGSGDADGGLGSGATRLLWVERGSRTVNASNVDGTGSAPLLSITGGPGSGLISIAVDAAAGRVYFIDEVRQRIQRANLDGSDVQNTFSGLDSPASLDLDIGAGKLYFTEQGSTPRVQRANLDGTLVEPLITAVEQPRGVAIDAAGGKLYLVDAGLDAVLSADLDGANLTNLNIAGVSDPLELSFDPIEGKLYWSELGGNGLRIRRANADGSAVEDVITPATLPGFSGPSGLEVDVAGRRLYFVEAGAAGSILSANLDGSDAALILGDLNEPTGLTLIGP